jgi:hypothetical protein
MYHSYPESVVRIAYLFFPLVSPEEFISSQRTGDWLPWLFSHQEVSQ